MITRHYYVPSFICSDPVSWPKGRLDYTRMWETLGTPREFAFQKMTYSLKVYDNCVYIKSGLINHTYYR